MTRNDFQGYEFGEFRLHRKERLLSRRGQAVKLSPKAFDVLVVLVENAGELVENREMLRLVWPDSFVEDANIQVQISTIRKVLGERTDAKMIETVPKIGYRFIADVKRIKGNDVSKEQSLEPIDAGPTSKPETATSNRRLSRATRPTPFLFVMIALLVVGGFAWAFYAMIVNRVPRSASWTNGLKQTKLTDSGSAFGAAIAPDGKYAAYITLSAGKYSISLTKLGDNSSVQITPPGDTVYSGLTFSPADDNIYYSAAENRPNALTSLYQIPRLGGVTPKLILAGTDSPIGFSPDGGRFAFIRQHADRGETALMTARADGSDEIVAAMRKSPDSFSVGKRPAMSPDGRTIACIGINAGEKFLRVFTVDTVTGAVNNITSEPWSALQDVIWLDADTLLVTAQDDSNFGPLQIWRVSISGGGVATKITHELNTYVGLSLSTDLNLLLTTDVDAFSNIWLIPMGDSEGAKQILSMKGGGRVEMSWTPNGRIVYTSNATGESNIYSMNADGSNQVQVTSDSFLKRSPVVSPDGQYIVFISSRAGAEQIWRMNINGEDLRQLGTDQVNRYPQFSQDGKWIIYTTLNDKKWNVYKLSLHGGEPEPLWTDLPFSPNVSPNMASIAYLGKDEETGKTKINIVSMGEMAPRMSFIVPANASADSIRWSPDGRGVIYRATVNNAGNFWLQPLAEIEPTQLTDIKYDFPIYCSLSRDMKQLSCLRNTLIRDIILFSAR